MSTVQMTKPHTVIAGRWRRRLSHAWAVFAMSATVVVLLVAMWAARSLLGLAVLLAGAVSVVVLGRDLVTSLVWRARWGVDARSAGLVLVARAGFIERGERVEVAPRLRRCSRCAGGRRYVVRPLPGQTPDDFRAAAPALSYRWGVPVVEVQHVAGERDVVLVAARMPARQDWGRS